MALCELLKGGAAVTGKPVQFFEMFRDIERFF